MERILYLLLFVCIAGYVQAVELKGNCSSSEQCSAGLACQYGTCRAKIGSNCTTPNSRDECVQNLTCSAAYQPCTCPVDQVASVDGASCGSKIGGACSRDVECVSNAICNKNTCECNTTFVRSYDSTTCKKGVGQSCPAANDCAENSECKNNTCGCKPGFSINNGRCAKTVGNNCTASSECSLMAECPTGATNRVCTCQSPYVLDTTSSFCKTSSATVLRGSILAALVLVLTSLAL